MEDPSQPSVLKRTPLRIMNNPNLPPDKLAKFRRRVLESESSKHPPFWTKVVHGAAIVLCMGYAFYSVIYQDHGDHEHIYSPLRRWYFKKLEPFKSLQKEDIKELTARGKLPSEPSVASTQ